MLSVEFIAEMKQKLLAAKDEIESELKGLPAHMEIDSDKEAQVDEAEQDFDNQGIRMRLVQDLQKIEKALQKIELGTYGVDDQGSEIQEERLRVLPWADTAL